MFSGKARRIVTIAFLGVMASPSLKHLDGERRTHARHATCEHHLKRHHPDPADRARFLKRAARQERREQQRARAEEERRALLAALTDDDPLSVRASSTPPDFDSRMKKGRRKSVSQRDDCSLSSTPQIRPAGDFLLMLRAHLQSRGLWRRNRLALLPHFGSGPCHAIPRPREGTTGLPPLISSPLA